VHGAAAEVAVQQGASGHSNSGLLQQAAFKGVELLSTGRPCSVDKQLKDAELAQIAP